jgi:small subunit ribosomal protein S6
MSSASQLYESLFIIRPSLPDEDVLKVHEKAKATVEKSGGSVERLENWGKKKLAYEVKQEKKGVYAQLVYRGNGPVVEELERFFRLDDAVIKFLTVKLIVDSPVEKPSPPMTSPVTESEHGRV